MKTKSFSSPKRSIFDACLKALKKLDCRVTAEDYREGSIKAEKGGGLLSYGHVIEVTVKSTEAEKVKVSVKSDSVGIQVIDWGTNSENEAKIIEAIVTAQR